MIDIIIDRCIDFDDLEEVVFSLFDLKKKQVEFVYDISIPLKGDPELVCELYPVGGDFCRGLSLYNRKGWAPTHSDELVILGKFCELLSCKCLTSDDSLDPHSWLLVHGRGDYEVVQLDIDRADETGEYVLIS